LALASGEPRVFACLDARMNEVYVAAYENGLVQLSPLVSPPAQVPLPPGENWVGCGDGFATYPLLLPAFSSVRPDVRPTAAAVAQLAASRFVNGEGVAAEHAMPLYVRDKVALTTAERLARGGSK
jgi:tRNA threonylcarbamoyladenosine biosynthesis protein TsaB